MAGTKRNPQQIKEDIERQSKVCCVCLERKPFSDFYNLKNKNDGKSYRCKECDNKARQAYLKKHKEWVRHLSRDQSLKAKYGINQEDYAKMLQAQDFCCAICGDHYTENKVGKHVDSLSVDHNYETGKIRGLLCNQCNRALGMLKDSPALLKRAYNYLIESES